MLSLCCLRPRRLWAEPVHDDVPPPPLPPVAPKTKAKAKATPAKPTQARARRHQLGNPDPSQPQTEEFRQALAEKQTRVDEFKAQLDALDRELEIASEEYNGAADRLAEMQSKVQVAQMDLENARQAYDLQSSILSQRAASNYSDGNMGISRSCSTPSRCLTSWLA